MLSVVFVRFLEDNRLTDPPRIAGPTAADTGAENRLERARDEHEMYFRAHPTQTDRDYLLHVFDEVGTLPGAKDLFGPHNPVRDLPNWLSGDAGAALLKFFRTIDPGTGRLVHDFTDPSWDTRFLGDLYQDLSESARKKYALLQTPVFVEEFILDRTLDPALDEFGLAQPGYESRLEIGERLNAADRFRMIDPACGSGHFLLGAFAASSTAGSAASRARPSRCSSSAHLIVCTAWTCNPYAVAIARFRLLIEAVRACGATRLQGAPDFAVHVFCGDSLLHGAGAQQDLPFPDYDHTYPPEDLAALNRVLVPGRFHAVVANPPYITPKDAGAESGLPGALLDLSPTVLIGGTVPAADLRACRGWRLHRPDHGQQLHEA